MSLLSGCAPLAQAFRCSSSPAEQICFRRGGRGVEGLPKCTVPAYRGTLTKFFAVAQKLRPGHPAPDFALEDRDRRKVSLHRRYKELCTKLHDKYKGSDVAFVNICVAFGMSDPGWFPALDRLAMDGINLLAVKWGDNPVCKAYNVNAIPHYVLMDKEGRMTAGDAPWPAQLVDGSDNPLDRLLHPDRVLSKPLACTNHHYIVF
jgi:hypothetical protein